MIRLKRRGRDAGSSRPSCKARRGARIASVALITSLFISCAWANGYQGYINSLDAILQERIQEALRNKGFNPGRIDGNYGSRTRNAIIAFRDANQIREGEFDEILTPLLAEKLLGIRITPGADQQDLGQIEQLAVIQELGLTPTQWFPEADLEQQIAVLRTLGLLPNEDPWEGFVFPE